MRNKTQEDLVMEQTGFQPQEETVKVTLPGIQTLHQKPTSEIAEVLATVLKSKNNVVKISYVIGSHIELTTQTH